jgi:hypothetical protein
VDVDGVDSVIDGDEVWAVLDLQFVELEIEEQISTGGNSITFPMATRPQL